jgi:hypothetical protein
MLCAMARSTAVGAHSMRAWQHTIKHQPALGLCMTSLPLLSTRDAHQTALQTRSFLSFRSLLSCGDILGTIVRNARGRTRTGNRQDAQFNRQPTVATHMTRVNEVHM